MRATTRHHVRLSGVDGAPAIVFAHGFGCDQNVRRHGTPAFEHDFRVATSDASVRA